MIKADRKTTQWEEGGGGGTSTSWGGAAGAVKEALRRTTTKTKRSRPHFPDVVNIPERPPFTAIVFA